LKRARRGGVWLVGLDQVDRAADTGDLRPHDRRWRETGCRVGRRGGGLGFRRSRRSTGGRTSLSSTCVRGRPWAAAARFAISSNSAVLPTPRAPASNRGRGAGVEGGDGDRFVGRLEDVVSAGEHGWHRAEADAIRACAAPAAFTACLYHAVLPHRCGSQPRP
jgi:hypothetical protein